MLFRYLHISDLHLTYGQMRGAEWAVEEFEQDLVLNPMLGKIRELFKDGYKFDLIFISGDLAQRGKREEYQVVEVFCKRLLEATELSADRLYIVPGNHDVNRSDVEKRHIRWWYNFRSPKEVADVLSSGDSFPVLMRKFKEFHDFSNRAMGRQFFDESRYHFVESVTFGEGKQTFRVNVVGLNSALFSGYDGDDERKLALGLPQVERALAQLDDKALFSIVFFHHPFGCFHLSDKVSENMLLKSADLILTGHLHTPTNTFLRDAAGQAVIIGAGASFETRESENSFNAVEIDLTTGKGRVQFYKYLHQYHCWKENTDANPNHPQGIFEFELERVKKNPVVAREAHGLAQVQGEAEAESNAGDKAELAASVNQPSAPVPRQQTSIHFIHDYLLPDSFTGRVEERGRLSAIINMRTDPISNRRALLTAVTAIGGMGKSCVVRKVAEEALDKSPYHHIVWFSFYDSSTEDVGYFLRNVMERIGDRSAAVSPDTEVHGSSAVKRLREKLCLLLEEAPVLLILDGFEVIQDTDKETSPGYGRIRGNYQEVDRLLSHICNQDARKQNASAVLLTSRVSLKNFEGVSGYFELPLGIFSESDGGDFLKRLGVQGTTAELKACSKLFEGHALCLKAAGRYMAMKHIPASQVSRITGDPEVFARTSEGERLKNIVDFYRADLTPQQEHFLKMLSIHPRSVSHVNFPVLIKGYGSEGRDDDWVRDEIMDTLSARGLIEVLYGDGESPYYSAHPLMKFAYETWMGERERKRAHETWAQASINAPGITPVETVQDLEHLQHYLEAIEHYLKADRIDEAWRIFRAGQVADRLDRLNYARRFLTLAEKFEKALDKTGTQILSEFDLLSLYDFLARAHNKLGNQVEELGSRKKYLELALRHGIRSRLDFARDLLADSYLEIGNVTEAKKIGPSGDIERGRLEMACGNFEKSSVLLRKAFRESQGHHKTVAGKSLGDALIRAKRIAEAEEVLAASLRLSEKESYLCCMLPILNTLIKLELKKGNLTQAQRYEQRRLALRKFMEFSQVEHKDLLLAEGRYDEVISAASKNISTGTDDKLDKGAEIDNLLVLAQAWHGKGDAVQAKQFLSRARDLIERTGCWREKDVLEEVERLISDGQEESLT